MKTITTEDGFTYTVPSKKSEFEKFQSAHTKAAARDEFFYMFPTIVGDEFQIGPYKTFVRADLAHAVQALPCIEFENKIYVINKNVFRGNSYGLFGVSEQIELEKKIKSLGMVQVVQHENHAWLGHTRPITTRNSQEKEPTFSKWTFIAPSPAIKPLPKDDYRRIKFIGVTDKDVDRLCRIISYGSANYPANIINCQYINDEAIPVLEGFLAHLPRLQILWGETKRQILKDLEESKAKKKGMTLKEYRAKQKELEEDKKAIQKTDAIIQVAPGIIELQQELNCFVNKLKNNEKFKTTEVHELRHKLKAATRDLLELRYLGKY